MDTTIGLAELMNVTRIAAGDLSSARNCMLVYVRTIFFHLNGLIMATVIRLCRFS